MEHPFVAQHSGAVNIQNGAQKVLELDWVKRASRAKHKAFDVVVMVVVRRMIAVFIVHMIMIVAMLSAVVMGVFMTVVVLMVVAGVVFQKVRVNVQLGIEVKAAQVKHLVQAHLAKMHRRSRRAWVHVL